MPQRVIDLPVVWLYILHDQKTLSSFICVCVRHFQTTAKFRAHLWCPTACLHNISSVAFLWRGPPPTSPSKKRMRITRQIFTPNTKIQSFLFIFFNIFFLLLLGGHCHSIQHCFGSAAGNGPSWFFHGGRWTSFMCVFASTCSHVWDISTAFLHSGFMHRNQSSQPLGDFLQSYNKPPNASQIFKACDGILWSMAFHSS